MILTKKEILELIEKGKLVQNLIDKDVQVQQCGVDLTASKLYTLEGKGQLDFSNRDRLIPEYKEIQNRKKEWNLKPGTYHIAMNEKIVLPDNIAGLLLPRSSALSCGLEIHSALWDPGYEGRSFIHVNVSRELTLLKNARIAQMIFLKLTGSTEKYKGIYKNEDIVNHGKRGNTENKNQQ